ncbi:hypothetical protein [Amniculibacterium aquaticum]|uniref:hypothetical protein n=1 Tax=Amniculibacterium aquaticum TaxID=2479858 RepID=UPI000F5AE23A|nr:hypothetical protein [Amniculibacterium aquaticum]
MPTKLNEKQLIDARIETPMFMANIASKTKLNLLTPIAFFEQKFNTDYEELSCIGYNPNSEELTAIIKIKKSSGYSGNLCTKGSIEYVRFYVDFGGGYQDQGYIGVNVHDILDTNDCDKKIEKPIEFAVRLKINPKNQGCAKPFLPKMKAVLLWQTIPPANDPNLAQPGYVWGNVKEAQIQIKPIKLITINPNITAILEKSILNPTIPLKTLVANNPLATKSLKEANALLTANKTSFSQLISEYKTAKANVEPQRAGFKFLAEAIFTKDVNLIKNSSLVFSENKLDYTKALTDLLASKGNTSYEEIGCVALDYHNEALIATFTAKKNFGYGGNLCSNGSKEYVTFWIQDELTHCTWKKIGTSIVNLHDIPDHKGLNYSAILPYDFSSFKQVCQNPKVVKVRAVLSWNVEPTGLDTPYWGNFKESYIQLSPKNWIGKNPKLILVGGISADNIDSVTGLTLPSAKFEINQNPVISGSRFMGKIAIHGVSAPFTGMKYRIKVINMTNGSFNYINDPLNLIGYDASGNIVHSVINPDPTTHYYTYQPYNLNITSQLALFSPGSSDRLNIVIEHEDGSLDSQIIQMDNTIPSISLKINDEGECVHFKKGDPILGKFSAVDNFMYKYTLGISGGTFTELKLDGAPQIINPSESTSIVRTTNVTNGDFKVITSTTKNCGNITLVMEMKTVVDSAYMLSPIHLNQAFCLKD